MSLRAFGFLLRDGPQSIGLQKLIVIAKRKVPPNPPAGAWGIPRDDERLKIRLKQTVLKLTSVLTFEGGFHEAAGFFDGHENLVGIFQVE